MKNKDQWYFKRLLATIYKSRKIYVKF